MSGPIKCPNCGAQCQAGTLVCNCGSTLPETNPVAPVESARPIASEQPFDIGKRLNTPYPVSRTCPKCGSTAYKSVQPKTMVAFTWDRVCQGCSTRYTPPTPLWARLIFAGFGLAALVGGAITAYAVMQGAHSAFGLLGPIAFILAGLGCLYKAVTA
jgi:hypothetical protein